VTAEPDPDRQCRCGWRLPVGVVAVRMGTEPTLGDFVPGVYVVLTCPACGFTQSFINALDPNAIAELDRQARELRRSQS
jgi:uncharacterized protein (DUF2225 family)